MADSRCGLRCTGCRWKDSHGCGGCIATMGRPFHGECPVAACCQNKGLAHCGRCDVMPCEKLYAYSYLDAEHGDRPQGARVQACREWAAAEGAQRWGNVLLTDSGWYKSFEGGIHGNILGRFHQMLGKPAAEARVLFIPTAATTDEARPAAGKCFAELLSAGMSPNYIDSYDIDGTMTIERAIVYDVVYFTGGDTRHLLKRMRDTGFDAIVKKWCTATRFTWGPAPAAWRLPPTLAARTRRKRRACAL